MAEQQTTPGAPSEAELRARLFRSLHLRSHRPLLLANVWDAASASAVAFDSASEAVATASYAVAAVRGVDDDDLDADANLAALERIAPAALRHGKPLTADIQDGYGDRLEEVVSRLVALGVSGCNIEDRDNATGQLYPVEVAAERIRRACEAAAAAGVPSFVVNARTDAVFARGDVEEAIARGRAYLAAGATTVFVWGGPKRGLSKKEVGRISGALGGRLNVIARLGADGIGIVDLADIGVARISVGPALWSHAMAAFRDKAGAYLREGLAIRERGTGEV